ncbi:MAG: patatin-like phospholipase family protein [Acidobacteriota bacterium]
MTKAFRAGTALSLSGGGYRATLFHAGAILRLNELGLLRKISRFVGVSGGAITLGSLAMNWPRLKWSDGVAGNLSTVLLDPLRNLCRRTIDVPSVLEGSIQRGRPAAEALHRAYKRHLFHDFELSEIPKRPTFIFQATNLSTGRAFRFYRDYVADYMIGSASSRGISLARAVAASSAFPPFLSPLTLRFGAGHFRRLPGATLNHRPEFTGDVKLTDGGVYDNLGLEPAWDSSMVLVSDAGAPFEHSAAIDGTWYGQVSRALDITTEQARSIRRRWLIDQFERGVRTGAYWGITTNIGGRGGGGATINRTIQEKICAIRTRLNRFTDQEQGQLINLGYALADASCRSRLSDLREAPFRFPDDKHSIC